MKFTIMLIMLTMLACGVQSNLPVSPKVEEAFFEEITQSSPTPTPQYAMVCMADTLNFRESAGTDSEVIVTLPDGVIVEVYDNFETALDGGVWRETSAGYANSKYLCVVE